MTMALAAAGACAGENVETLRGFALTRSREVASVRVCVSPTTHPSEDGFAPHCQVSPDTSDSQVSRAIGMQSLGLGSLNRHFHLR